MAVPQRAVRPGVGAAAVGGATEAAWAPPLWAIRPQRLVITVDEDAVLGEVPLPERPLVTPWAGVQAAGVVAGPAVPKGTGEQTLR